MSALKVALLAAGLALAVTPCLALTYSSAPESADGRSMLINPDAALEGAASAMQDAYMRNNADRETATSIATGAAVYGSSRATYASGSVAGGQPGQQNGLVAGGGLTKSAAPAR